MSVDLSSFADLLKGFGTAFGGKVTGDLGSAGDWKLEVIRDGDTAYLQVPTPRGPAACREDMDQGRREDALQRRRRAAAAVRLVRRHRPARRPRAAEGRLRLDHRRRQRQDPRRRDEPLPRDDRHGEARAARSGRPAPEPRQPRPDRQAGRRDGASGGRVGRRRSAGSQDLDRSRREAAAASGMPVEGIARRRALRLRNALELELPPADEVVDAAAFKRHPSRTGPPGGSVTLKA